jgi:hypothetical protein
MHSFRANKFIPNEKNLHVRLCVDMITFVHCSTGINALHAEEGAITDHFDVFSRPIDVSHNTRGTEVKLAKKDHQTRLLNCMLRGR